MSKSRDNKDAGCAYKNQFNRTAKSHSVKSLIITQVGKNKILSICNMNYFASFVLTAALLGTLIEAYPQSLGGSVSSNPRGGTDARLELAKGIGTPEHNVIGKVFAAGNTNGGPVATGGALAYNNNGLGAAISKTHIPGVRDTFTQSASANLFNNGVHSLDANAFASQNKLANGFKFDRNGAGLDYSHINGHGASLTHSNIPNFGSQLELGGKANLWSSQDRNTRLDLTGSGSKWMSGPLSGQKDFSAGLGLTHLFG